MKTVLIFLLAMASAVSTAAADVVISPLRLVVDADTREGRIIVSNPTGRILEGRAGWIDLKATPTGYQEASVGDRQRMSAAPWFTLHPAFFTLAPGARAEIVIRLKEGVAPPPGERRSHLLVTTAASRTLLRKAGESGLQADIGAGVSAPVLLRGSGAASAKIEDTRLLRDAEGMLLLSTAIISDGAHSTYGRLTAVFTPDQGHRTEQRLAIIDNVAGYPDAERRVLELPLGHFSLGKGKLTVKYEGRGEYEGRIFDERRYDIAPPQSP